MKTTLSLIAVAGLSSAALGGTIINEVEPNDTALTAQSLGVLNSGDMVYADHVASGGTMTADWFSFTLPDLGTGTWSIETLEDTTGNGPAGSDNIADTRLFLYSDAGTTLVTSDDDGGQLDPDTNFGLSLITGVAAGTYYLENDGFADDDGTFGANYLLSFTFNPVPTPGCLALLGLAGIAGRRRRR